MQDKDKAYLRRAVQLAMESVDHGGAPFGALVVHNGEVIAKAGNRAKQECDPTAQETANRAGFADGNIAEELYGQIHPVRPEQLGLTQIEVENSAAPFQAWLRKHDLQSL